MLHADKGLVLHGLHELMAHLRNLAEDGAIPERVIDELMGTWPPTGLVGCVGSVIETGYWHMTQEMQICVAARGAAHRHVPAGSGPS